MAESGSASSSPPLSWSELNTNPETGMMSFPLKTSTSRLRQIHINRARLPTQENGRLSAEGDKRLRALLTAMTKGVDDPENIEFSLENREYTGQCTFGRDGRVQTIKIIDVQDPSRYLWIDIGSYKDKATGDPAYFPPQEKKDRNKRGLVIKTGPDLVVFPASERRNLQARRFQMQVLCNSGRDELQKLGAACNQGIFSFKSKERENFYALVQLLEHIDQSNRSGLSQNTRLPSGSERLEFLAHHLPEGDIIFAGQCGPLSQPPFEFVLGILSNFDQETQIRFEQAFITSRPDVQKRMEKELGLSRSFMKQRLGMLLMSLHMVDAHILEKEEENKHQFDIDPSILPDSLKGRPEAHEVLDRFWSDSMDKDSIGKKIAWSYGELVKGWENFSVGKRKNILPGVLRQIRENKFFLSFSTVCEAIQLHLFDNSSQEDKDALLEALEQAASSENTAQDLLNRIRILKWEEGTQTTNNELLEKILTQLSARDASQENVLLHFDLFLSANDSGEKARIAKAAFDSQDELFNKIREDANKEDASFVATGAAYLALAGMIFYYLMSDKKEAGILECSSENGSEPDALNTILSCMGRCVRTADWLDQILADGDSSPDAGDRDLLQAFAQESILISLKLFKPKPQAKLKEGESEATRAMIDAWALQREDETFNTFLPYLKADTKAMNQ